MLGINLGATQRDEPAREYMTARLNARVQPVDRGEYFEDPLDEAIGPAGIGEVIGGGTQLADEPAGIEFCDLEIRVANTSNETLSAIIERLEALGAPRGSKLILDSDGREIPFGFYEGIGIFLNGVDLPDSVYEECDVNHVTAELDRLMGEDGSFRGCWHGAQETALYCYGPCFETMKAAIEPLLAAYPLCAKARIEQIA